MSPGQKIAIVGSGISGLVAARHLHEEHEITVFEAARQIGGHTHTVTVDAGEVGGVRARGTRRGELPPVEVDMGFIVYNERTYPNFVRLLGELGVATEASDMSFSVRSEARDLEWQGSSLDGVFAQRRNLLRPSVWRMLRGIFRFHARAEEILALDAGVTLGDYLDREGFRGPFVELYLLPMLSAIWSTEPGRMRQFPVRTLAAFLHNHGMLTIGERPQWRVVSGGSRRYLEPLVAPFRRRIRTSSPVRSVRRSEGGVEIRLDGETARFDAVVFACHSNQALALLADPTLAEREVLGAILYSRNDVVLHTDASLMPRRSRAWASWNYHLDPPEVAGDVAFEAGGGTRVTYWMNRLQNLRTGRPIFVSLNRTPAIDPSKVLVRRSFSHPLFTAAGIRAQERWGEISRGRTHFCGAYWGYGFHEDGVKSGLRVADALGAELGESASPSRRTARRAA